MWVISAFIVLVLTSCFSREDKPVKYEGFDDLFIGINRITLYEDGDFCLELGAGAKDGRYVTQHDTVFLNYEKYDSAWPLQILMKEDYFETLPSGRFSAYPKKISRRYRVD